MGAFWIAQTAKNLPAMQETWVHGEITWRRAWQPTSVFLPGQRSKVVSSTWGCKESDMTERLTQTDRQTHTHTPPHTHTARVYSVLPDSGHI